MSKPNLIYFNIQAGVEFESVTVKREELKADLDKYHFGQVPRFVDDQVDICQSGAILRHVGRKHGLYGASLAEQAAVDEVLEGGVDLLTAYFRRVVFSKDDPSAKEAYWSEHWAPATATAATAGGAHAAYLSRLLKRGGDSGYFVPSGLTIADVYVTVLVQRHILAFGRDRVAQQAGDLLALHDRVLALPRVAAYLSSPQHPAAVSIH